MCTYVSVPLAALNENAKRKNFICHLVKHTNSLTPILLMNYFVSANEAETGNCFNILYVNMNMYLVLLQPDIEKE